MLLPSPSKGPRSVSCSLSQLGCCFSRSCLAHHQPVSMPAGCALHMGCLMYTLPYLVTQTLPLGHLSMLMATALPGDISLLLCQMQEDEQQSHPCSPFCAPSPTSHHQSSLEQPQSCYPVPWGGPFLAVLPPLAELLGAEHRAAAPAHSHTGTTNSPFPGSGAAPLSAELLQGSAALRLFRSIPFAPAPPPLLLALRDANLALFLATCSWGFPPSAVCSRLG